MNKRSGTITLIALCVASALAALAPVSAFADSDIPTFHAAAGGSTLVAESIPTQESHLMDMRASPDVAATGEANNVKGLRAKAVFEAAQTYAAQVSYCEEAKKLNAWNESHSATLDSTYNFKNLLLDGGRVLPAVIEQDDASFKLQNENTAVTAAQTWNILEPAKIVSTAPDWRQYLNVACVTPLTPNAVLLPGALDKTKASDEAQWEKGVRSGWSVGKSQAQSAFRLGMAKLTRDYVGMLRFYELSQRGVVTVPVLATGKIGVRVDGRMLNVNETVFRLTGNVDWQDQSKWKGITPGSVK